MPWRCPKCTFEYPQPSTATPPVCTKTANCKKAGDFATCVWIDPPIATPVILAANDATKAATLGYATLLKNLKSSEFNGHATSQVYSNNKGTLAISPDGSTHSGDRIGWKAFKRENNKWVYKGSYDLELNPWPFRTGEYKKIFGNNTKTPPAFPHG